MSSWSAWRRSCCPIAAASRRRISRRSAALAYVGITRAQRSLTMTYAAKRKRYGELVRCEPSRFLQELPEEDLSWEGGKSSLSPEQKQERGSAHLANLRAMLS